MLYSGGSYGNRESGHLNNSAPTSPAAADAGPALEQRERLESSISHVSGNQHLITFIVIFCEFTFC